MANAVRHMTVAENCRILDALILSLYTFTSITKNITKTVIILITKIMTINEHIFSYIHIGIKMDILMVYYEKQEGLMFHIDKTFLHPNISVTVRFTPVLYEWLKSVCEREGMTFNHLVLQCCKNCMEMDLEETKAEEPEAGR